MKVITIKQPFASLIIAGLKEYEFRTWKTNYRGPILIHAGKGIDKNAMKKYEQFHLEYPTGCILGIADLTDCIKIDEEAKTMLKQKKSIIYENQINNKENNHYGFKLENIKTIEPIYINGQLGLWNYNDKIKIKTSLKWRNTWGFFIFSLQ